MYDITPAGRDALRKWLAQPTAALIQIEMESMIRVSFADSGAPTQLIATIRSIGAEAAAAAEHFAAMAEESLDGRRFPQRWTTNALGMELLVRIDETLVEWAKWAEAEASSWPTVRRSVGGGPVERGAALLAAVADREKH